MADFYNHRVQVLGPSGNFLRQYGSTGESGDQPGQFTYPTDVALLPDGSLVVADAYNDRIQVFGPSGTFRHQWGGPSTGEAERPDGRFSVASGVAVSADGHVFVADFNHNRIQEFTADGSFVATFGSQGTVPGRFDRPTDIAVDRAGNVYVVDYGNDRIQKLGSHHSAQDNESR